jgi:hypothetical protein
MLASREAPQQAINVHSTPDHSNPKETRLICSIASEFDVPHVTLSCLVRHATMDHSQAHIHRQTVTEQEELALVDYIMHQCLAGNSPPPRLI